MHDAADKLGIPLGQYTEQVMEPHADSVLQYEEKIPCSFMENCRCYAHNPSKYLNRVYQFFCSTPDLSQFCSKRVQARCLERDAKEAAKK